MTPLKAIQTTPVVETPVSPWFLFTEGGQYPRPRPVLGPLPEGPVPS